MERLLLLARIIVSATFLFSAYSKLIAPGVFEITMIDQGIVDERGTAAYLARFIIGLEVAIGFLFLQPYYLKRIISPFTILLLLVFSAHLVYLMTIGDNENCGCFGDLIEMTPLESLLKNALLIGVSVFIFFKLETRKALPLLPLGITMASILCVFLLLPTKSIEGLQFAQYTHFEGQGRVDLTQGDKLLAIFVLGCDHCQKAAAQIDSLKKTSQYFPETYVLFFDEGEGSVESFNTISNTNYPYHMIGDDEFWGYIGNSAPRIYWLQSGEIAEFWDGNYVANISESFDLE